MKVNNNNNDFSIFRKFYTGEMSSEEKKAFEDGLDDDPFAKEAFEGFLLLKDDFARISAIENMRMDLRKDLDLETRNTFPLKTIFGIAASVLVLLSAYFVVSNIGDENQIVNHDTKKVNETASQKEIIVEDDYFDDDTLGFQDSVNIEEEIIEVVEEEEPMKEEKSVKEKTVIEKKVEKNSKVKDSKENRKPNKKQISSENYDFYRNQRDETNKAPNTEVSTTENKAFNIEEVTERTSLYNTIYAEDDLNTEVKSDFDEGLTAYKKGEYSKSIRFFNTSINNKKKVNSSNYYIAMSYYNQNKLNKAIKLFDEIIVKKTSFKNNALWYKSLAFLRKGQKSDAKIIFQEIVNSNSSFKAAAQEQLVKLE